MLTYLVVRFSNVIKRSFIWFFIAKMWYKILKMILLYFMVLVFVDDVSKILVDFLYGNTPWTFKSIYKSKRKHSFQNSGIFRFRRVQGGKQRLIKEGGWTISRHG